MFVPSAAGVDVDLQRHGREHPRRRRLHAAYNLSAATAVADGTIAAGSTACVIFWAVSLIQAERVGRPALGGARRV